MCRPCWLQPARCKLISAQTEGSSPPMIAFFLIIQSLNWENLSLKIEGSIVLFLCRYRRKFIESDLGKQQLHVSNFNPGFIIKRGLLWELHVLRYLLHDAPLRYDGRALLTCVSLTDLGELYRTARPLPNCASFTELHDLYRPARALPNCTIYTDLRELYRTTRALTNCASYTELRELYRTARSIPTCASYIELREL